MINFLKSFKRVAKDEKGTQLVETAIWLGIVAAASVTIFTTIGTDVGQIYNGISTEIAKAPGAKG